MLKYIYNIYIYILDIDKAILGLKAESGSRMSIPPHRHIGLLYTVTAVFDEPRCIVYSAGTVAVRAYNIIR
jgi:hypothetical protein